MPGRCVTPGSNGFEALAISPDRMTPYPILEGPVTGDSPATRRVHAFDIATRRYVDRLPDYQVATPDLLVSDATALGGKRLVVLERDNLEGAEAKHKRGFVVDLSRQASGGTLAKHQVVDLLDLDDPAEISLPGRPGEVGLGAHFSMPYLTNRERAPARWGPARHRQRHQLRLHRTPP